MTWQPACLTASDLDLMGYDPDPYCPLLDRPCDDEPDYAGMSWCASEAQEGRCNVADRPIGWGHPCAPIPEGQLELEGVA